MSAAFSPDGTHVVTASWDQTARVWDVPLASGTLAEWRTTMERTSPYRLVNGVLVLMGTVDAPVVSFEPSVPMPSMPPP